MVLQTKAFKSRLQQDDIYSIDIDDFFKSAFSVDCVIFGYHEGQLKVLLIERGAEPYENFWALPGDLVYPLEDLDSAARRVLEDLTSLKEVELRQVHTFGKVDRHPLGRVITVAYTTLVETSELNPVASSWAKESKWHSVKKLPKLAFDHREILDNSFQELRNIIRYEPIWTNVLPEKFTLGQLQLFYESVYSITLDKGNFRKKIQGMKFIQKLGETQKEVNHRPSQLYRFDRKLFNAEKKKGFSFEI
ncbi:MAG: NUDIX hydrolase [Flavobacteriales bacterium]|jgi:8-oxo-dGTP diphosphatase